MRPSTGTLRALGFALLAGLASAPSSPATAPAAPTALAAGSSLERDMAVEEVHRYAIDLRAGEYLQVMVEQRGVDVELAFSAPDGTVLLESDSPAGYIGPEPLAVVATTAGAHEL